MIAQVANPRGPDQRAVDSAAEKPWLWLLLLALAVRLPFVWLAPNNGEDALSRFQDTVSWLKAPGQLPLATSTGNWLPLHFWLLGAVVWLWHSELSARLFTMLLGALTILPYWGILKCAFDRRVALASALAFALFSYHIAYSVTTSSEAPTLFLLACGVYCWLRFLLDGAWKWCVPAGICLSAASLIRFDAWIFVAALSVLSLDFSKGWASLTNQSAWVRATGFALLAGGGGIGWMIFSQAKWGDSMELLHRNIAAIHSIPPILRHSLPFRLVVVPVSLVVALSPFILIAAAVGIVWVLEEGSRAAKALGVVALSLFAWSYLNSIFNELTAARYTLMYDWLLIPFAFEAFRRLAKRRPGWWPDRTLYAAALVLFVLWETTSAVAGHYAPAPVADHLGPMSPLLEPHVETRGLTHWLRHNVAGSDTIVVDEFGFQSSTILQISRIDPSRAFQVHGPAYSDPVVLRSELSDFISARHPRFAVCSPYGPIGLLWSLDDRERVEVPDFGITLSLQWRGPHWRVYRISYAQSRARE